MIHATVTVVVALVAASILLHIPGLYAPALAVWHACEAVTRPLWVFLRDVADRAFPSSGSK